MLKNFHQIPQEMKIFYHEQFSHENIQRWIFPKLWYIKVTIKYCTDWFEHLTTCHKQALGNNTYSVVRYIGISKFWKWTLKYTWFTFNDDTIHELYLFMKITCPSSTFLSLSCLMNSLVTTHRPSTLICINQTYHYYTCVHYCSDVVY